jgi:tetratricopeptide (TPR) repeat protein
VSRHYTDNVEAYELYLRGLYQSYQRTPEGFRRGIGYLEQAVREDPNYALAYSGLAQTYARLPIAVDAQPEAVTEKARNAAVKALELDGALAQAHVSSAIVKYFLEWDWPGVEREFALAIEIDPNDGPARLWHAHYLSTARRSAEAITEARRAMDLDPLSELSGFVLGMSLYHARQYDQAIVALQDALKIDSKDPFDHGWLGDAYAQKRNYGEAVAEFHKTLELEGQAPQRGEIVSESLYHSMHVARLAHTLAASGNETEARKLLSQLKEASKQRYVPSYSIALIHAGLREREQALEWLEKAYQERDVRLVFLGVDPKWDPFSEDPRFQNLVLRIGLVKQRPGF